MAKKATPTKFRKKIIQPGKYYVPQKDADPIELAVSKKRTAKWVKTMSTMLGNGLRIPAPWQHDRSEPSFTQNGADTKPSKDNAGYWTKFWQEKDGSLYGELTVDNPEDAAKVGTNVTEVSPLIKQSWKDGNNNSYDDIFAHVALVTHPVIPSQDNFEQIESTEAEPAIALSLSMLDKNYALSHNFNNAEEEEEIESIISGLKTIGVVMPDDTTSENFMERLQSALVQKNADVLEAKKAGSLTTQPPGTHEQNAPIVMSIDENDTKETLLSKLANFFSTKSKKEGLTEDNIVKSMAVKDNSTTLKEKVKTMTQDLIVDDVPEQNSPAMNALRKNARGGYETRIRNLFSAGKITKNYANKTLAPMLGDLALSIDAEGNMQPTVLDQILEPLESLPDFASLNGKAMSTQKTQNVMGKRMDTPLSLATEEELVEPTNDEKLSEDRVDEIVKGQFAAAGMRLTI